MIVAFSLSLSRDLKNESVESGSHLSRMITAVREEGYSLVVLHAPWALRLAQNQTWKFHEILKAHSRHYGLAKVIRTVFQVTPVRLNYVRHVTRIP